MRTRAKGPPPGVEVFPPSDRLKQKTGGGLRPLGQSSRVAAERRLLNTAAAIEADVAEAAARMNALAQSDPPDLLGVAGIAHELRGLAATCGLVALGRISDCVFDVVDVALETRRDAAEIVAKMSAAAHLSVRTPAEQADEAAALCRAMAQKWLTR